MATYDYKGTKITGTSTTAKVFEKSGVTNATVNQIYFNTEKGHVYKCTTAGNASTAKWQYQRTDIAHKPSDEVTSLGSPVRTTVSSNNHYMKATWKVPSELTNTKNGDRATGLEVDWTLVLAGKNNDLKKVKTTGNQSLTTHQINLNSLSIGGTTYNRDSFYPADGKPRLKSVTVKVKATNSEGSSKGVSATREFKKPRKPTISGFSFNNSNGAVTCSITTNAGTDYRERYDTKYTIEAYNSNTKKTTKTTSTSTNTTITGVTFNPSGYQGLNNDNYYKVTVTAWARGYAGISEKVPKTCYISSPTKSSIGKIEARTDRCVVNINTPKKETHPVTGVRLQYLANTTYEKASDIPNNASWSDYSVQDDGKATALVIDKNTIAPDAGKYSWVRVKTWNWDESVASLVRYSDPQRVKLYESKAATATDDKIKIISTTAGADGKSIKVQLAWTNDGNTGTELTWSDEEDTWKSTKEPEKHEFTWTDGSYTSGGTTYAGSALITIKELEPTTKYYIHARRYLDGDNGTTYSAAAIKTCVTSNTSSDAAEVAETIVASCNGTVAKGDSLQVYWAFCSAYIQQDWQIISTAGKVLVEGYGSYGAAQIPADRLETAAVNGVVNFKVVASSGNDPVESNELFVAILDKPTASVALGTNFSSGVMTAQQAQFTVTASTPCDLMVIISSQGAVGQFPTGIKRQTEGDTIYSDILSGLTWTASGSNYTSTITLPIGLDFWDLGSYTLTITAIDRETNLSTEIDPVSFSVGWTNKAKTPFDFVTITPVDTIDDNGKHIKKATIALTPPTSSASTDVYDIYRLTGDGAVLIGEGFPRTLTTDDMYAPFGDDMTHHYRVALRTVDGDVNFSDIEYVADGDYLKLDWDGHSIDLPYSISIADSYEKSVEIRQHMDGGVDAYWNNSIIRRGRLSTDVIRLIQQDEIDLVRQLARYSGPVFVRTPDGCAYEADVQVTDLSTKNKAVMSIAIDATEIGLTQEFLLPIPFTV